MTQKPQPAEAAQTREIAARRMLELLWLYHDEQRSTYVDECLPVMTGWIDTIIATARAEGAADARREALAWREALEGAQSALVGIHARANGGGESYEEMLGDIAEQATAALNEIERYYANIERMAAADAATPQGGER